MSIITSGLIGALLGFIPGYLLASFSLSKLHQHELKASEEARSFMAHRINELNKAIKQADEDTAARLDRLNKKILDGIATAKVMRGKKKAESKK